MTTENHMRLSVDNPALHLQTIHSHEMADIALAHAPDLGIDEPHKIEHISKDFLQEILAKDMAGKKISGAKLEKMTVCDSHVGMTSRCAWDLQWNEAGKAAGLPQAVFAKGTPDEPYMRETLALLHMAEHEVNFYNQVQPELDCLAPNAFYAKSFPGGRFLLIIEDLRERQIRPYWAADDCSIEHAKAVATAQAQLHAKFWDSDRLTTDLTWVRPRTRRFGGQWHLQSFKESRSGFLESDIGKALPEKAKTILLKYDANFLKILDYWDSKPSTLLHGDSHLGNTFSYPDGRAGYFDWQVILRGYGVRDLNYFLHSALSNEKRIQHEQDIFTHYLNELTNKGISLDREQAWNDYCLYTLDVWDAIIKTFMRGGYGHASSAINRQLDCIANAIIDNDVGNRLDALVD